MLKKSESTVPDLCADPVIVARVWIVAALPGHPVPLGAGEGERALAVGAGTVVARVAHGVLQGAPAGDSGVTPKISSYSSV